MDPIYKSVPRSWFERLFTFPWNPMETHKDVRDYAAEFARTKRTNTRHQLFESGVYCKAARSVKPPQAAEVAGRRRDDPARPIEDAIPVWPPFVDTVSLGGFRQVPEMVVTQHLVSGSGGDFAGAGAGDSWAPAPPPDSSSSSSDSSSGSAGD